MFGEGDELTVHDVPFGHYADNYRPMIWRDANDSDHADAVFLGGYREALTRKVLPTFSTGSDTVIDEVALHFNTLACPPGDPDVYIEMLKGMFMTIVGSQSSGEALVQGTPFSTMYSPRPCMTWASAYRYHSDIPEGVLEPDFSQSERIRSEIFNTCRGRRLFVAGNHFELGPATMETGDIIVILFGSPWPIVLRPTGDWYSLVGPCYIYAIMHGEAVVGKQQEGVQPQMFEIR